MTIDPTGLVITEPGIYDGIPDEAYHADPVPGGSLSSSGARMMLPPSCPARYRWERDNPPPARSTYDLGHAAHRLVLGVGPEIEVVDAPDWRTRAARDQRDAAHAAGRVPLLAAEYRTVQAMAAALRRHPLAAALLNPELGRPEQSAFWVDEQTGVWLRARYDFLRDRAPGRPLIVDYKTTESADASHIERAVRRYGYHQQDAWYLDGLAALGAAIAGFVFIFQEKAAPYLVHVVELDQETRDAGRARNRRAIDVYRRCVETGHWPGYADDVSLISLPPYALRDEEF